MGFVVVHIAGMLLQPAAILIVVAALGTFLLPRRAGVRLARIGVAGLLLILLLPVQQWLLLPLENRFARPSTAPAHVDGIIVLGGAIRPIVSAERGVPSLNRAAERMTEFVALSRRYPDAKLVFTGGIATLIADVEPEAAIALKLFVSLGLPANRVILESESRTTYENAVNVTRIVGAHPDGTWLLVTSANHMPRGIGAFRAMGWQVQAWPVAYEANLSLSEALTTPLGQKLDQMDTALHEWAGLLVYRLTGKTSELLPGP